MDQIRRLIASLTLRQRIIVLAAAIAVAGGLVYFLRWQAERDFALLYSGLSQEDANSVVQKLKETGTEYRLSADGGTIKVKTSKVPDLRLQMAGSGILKSGRSGWELFDSPSFVTSEEETKVKHQRALEGELERTIKSISEVENVRVHITPAKNSLYGEERQPAKASVLLHLKSRAGVSAQNIKAITNLVASAVEDLNSDKVSVVDSHGNLLTRPKPVDATSDSAINEQLYEYKAKIERDLSTKLNNTLEAMVGPDHFRASILADCDLSTTDESQENFDPTRSVMTNSQRTEDLAGTGQASGVPGAASNLPRPTSRPGLAGQGVARRTENINFATTRMITKRHLPQGSIKRLSVSVILDQPVRFEGAGPKAKRIYEAPSPERLKQIRDVVAGVVGFQVERNDLLVVESSPFGVTMMQEPPPLPPAAAAPAPNAPGTTPVTIGVPAWLQTALKKKDPIILGALGGGLLVLLLGIGAFVFLRKKKAKAKAKAKAKKAEMAAEAQALAGETADSSTPALPSGAAGGDGALEQQLQAQLAEKQRLMAAQEHEILAELTASVRGPSNATKKAEILIRHLGEESKRDPEAVAQLLRTWMSDGDQDS